ncbi:hypothetical protein R1sor_023061 [Riccia sorocarpa]|uniref:Mitochondrial glycoprotein n=1 Tax=Riccia sorocarpa TaxID=122646 RepID=A0ABD3GPT0_9MARC
MRVLTFRSGARAAAAAAFCDMRSFLLGGGAGLLGHHSGLRQRWCARSVANEIGAGGSGSWFAFEKILTRGYAVPANSQLRGQLRGEDQPNGLLHVLRCEIDDLRAKAKAITRGSPPKPWNLVKDESGELELTLGRKYGLEDIMVSCVFQLVPKDYQREPVQGEDPEMRKKMMQLTVSITKGTEYPFLRLLCECYRDGFAVHQVDLKSETLDETVYRPYFSESKQKLVDEVQIFLYERGINGLLATYLHKSLEYKRLFKSSEMLEKIEFFLK